MKSNINQRFFISLFGFLALVGFQETSIAASKGKVKNLIMIIGDGMGPQQIGLLLSYAKQELKIR